MLQQINKALEPLMGEHHVAVAVSLCDCQASLIASLASSIFLSNLRTGEILVLCLFDLTSCGFLFVPLHGCVDGYEPSPSLLLGGQDSCLCVYACLILLYASVCASPPNSRLHLFPSIILLGDAGCDRFLHRYPPRPPREPSTGRAGLQGHGYRRTEYHEEQRL